MRKKKFICLIFLVCCILLCSACGIQCSNNEEISHISTESAEYSEIPTIDFTPPIDADGIIEYVDPSDVEKYFEKEFTHDEITDDLLQAFVSSISTEELQIIEKAWIDAPSDALRGAEAHIYVLLRALQNTDNTDIKITSAKFVPYTITEMVTSIEETFGCDAYALQIVDDSNNLYLVWDGFVYEEVICNGETIYSRYHLVF